MVLSNRDQEEFERKKYIHCTMQIKQPLQHIQYEIYLLYLLYLYTKMVSL